MQTIETRTKTPSTQATPARHLGLDDLAAMSYEELESLYRASRAPASLVAANGPLVGRMLRVRGLGRTAAGEALRRFAASRAFVWGGKTFAAKTDVEGEGINRIRLPGVLGRQNLFPFGTRFDASAIDGEKAIVLDYDRPENPPYIRKIHDEIREVSPGLFLGPAMWKAESRRTTVLWFALDARLS